MQLSSRVSHRMSGGIKEAVMRKSGMLLVVLYSALSISFLGYSVVAAQGENNPDPDPVVSLPIQVADGGAFILNGTLYYTGGWSGNLSSPNNKLYSLSLTNPDAKWESEAGVGRFGIDITAHDRNAYVVGGYDGRSFSNQVNIFDGDTNNWLPPDNMPVQQHFAAVTALDGNLYVAGGIPFNAEVWRARITSGGNLDNWAQDSQQLNEQLIGAQLVGYQDCLYFLGGKDSAGQPHGTVYASSIREDGSLGGWFSTPAALPKPLAFHGAALHRDTLYIVGGETSNRSVSGKIYRTQLNAATCGLAANQWETFDTLPKGGLQRMSVVSRWGELYIMGGKLADETYTDAVWRYDLPTPPASMSLQKSVEPTSGVGYGDLLTYTLRYANTWGHEQTNIIITDTVPAGTQAIEGAATDVVSWSLGTVDADVSKVLSFTVETLTPTWSVDINQSLTWHPEISDTSSVQFSEGFYTLTYTPTARLEAGLLITDTLPSYLSVFDLTTDVDEQDYGVSVRTQGDREQVIVRILPRAEITRPGTVQLKTCVTQSFTASTELVNEIAVNDSYRIVTDTLTEQAKPGSTLIISSAQECTRAFTPSQTLPPLYPAVRVSNTATVSSAELEDPMISNQVVNEWPAIIWPIRSRIYLPLVMRQ
jgi:uncharacterized repeat protein (TIGR01451 family)